MMIGGRLSGPVHPLQSSKAPTGQFAALNVGSSLTIPTRASSSEPVIRNKRPSELRVAFCDSGVFPPVASLPYGAAFLLRVVI
ncbi:MAG: hypothetical protein OJF51_002511 [Nitrospira sp.]|jgi:hypothetical protein|nr:MAG: hypothetical protein OJF51_002511 [Nitrospira sp.]